MKKILSIMLTAVLVAGCSAFTGGDNKEPQEPTENNVKITEEYTHEDPKGLDFDKRIVLQIPEESYYFEDIKDQIGAEVTGNYKVFYGKEGKPVGYYDYMICKDEENATLLKEFYVQSGAESVVENNLCIRNMSQDAIDADISQYLAMSLIEDDSVESYAQFYIDNLGAVEVK